MLNLTRKAGGYSFKAMQYLYHFLQEDARCFQNLLKQMDAADRAAFRTSIQTISAILNRLPHPPAPRTEL